ncbi:MAG: TIGR03013 family PEP-CTERM/XrtA system glycosyltransferase [Acidobacteria bacterium]|nr:TIGR03013 family PEP-CTERM/XrtA system glycosyltransferase [Acidobacteriota bacterium]
MEEQVGLVMSKNGSRCFALLIFESILTCLCGVAALYIRFGVEAHAVLIEGVGWLKILLLMVVVQGSFYISDLYDFRMIRIRAVLYLRIIQAIGLAALALALVFYLLPRLLLGRGVFVVSLMLMLTTMIYWRVFVMWLIGHPRLAERVLILGTGERAVNVAREVLEQREVGYQVVGFVGDDPRLLGKSLINPRVIGLTSELETLVNQYHVDRIVVVLNERRKPLPLGSLLDLRLRDGIAIEESASFYERLTGKISLELLRPIWLIFSSHSRFARMYKHWRRMIDVAAALVGLIVSLPVMAVTALAIKLDSPGPIFYTQERVGRGDERFRIVKFRSMKTDAEKDGPVWARQADDRVTRVGRIIRKLRIDELPQFFNVLRGEMSFIGPRPERPEFVQLLERKIPFYSQRHLVKPGLTGWAQIRYPYGASVKDAMEKLQYDLYYIKNQSPILDVIIIFETVRIVIFGRGAR